MVSLLAFIFILGILIGFHEFGHYLAARLCGVGIETFSIGFGPRLIHKKIGLTDYRISLIPLGGYVKMVGDEPGRELKPEFARLSFNGKPLWQKSLIAAAGPAFNFLLAIIIFFGIFAFYGVPTKNSPNQLSFQKIKLSESARLSVVVTGQITKLQVSDLVKMISGEISAKENLYGPIAIYRMSGQNAKNRMSGQSAKKGAFDLFYLIAILSISLAILNLLPIPTLDGGHLLFFGIEAVKGGPVNLKTKKIAQWAGSAIIIILIIFVFYNDIARIFNK